MYLRTPSLVFQVQKHNMNAILIGVHILSPLYKLHIVFMRVNRYYKECVTPILMLIHFIFFGMLHASFK